MPETKNLTNTLPMYKIGQILTWQEEGNHKGFKSLVEVSGVIKSIKITKEYVHQISVRPSIYYTIISTKSDEHKWVIEQYHLRALSPKISIGYAVDDKERE